ncbi:MAG: methyl-accepting chemotaxis protein [Acidobacteria bacterium]|nr:methyl-accepting chemotaxis protein [Acidobacteriota bacterium]
MTGRFLNRLRISQKLLLSSLAFSLPIAVLLYFVVGAYNRNIELARSEIVGNRFCRYAYDLLGLVSENLRLAGMARPGDAASEVPLHQVEQDTEKALAAFFAGWGRYGGELQITAPDLEKAGMGYLSPDTVRGLWASIRRARLAGNFAEVERLSCQLLGSLEKLTTRAIGVSHLFTDPDLDTCYLMDAVHLGMPNLIARLYTVYGRLPGQGTGAGVLTEMARTLLAPAVVIQEADLPRIRTDLEGAIREDRNYYGVSVTLQGELFTMLGDFEIKARSFVSSVPALLHPSADAAMAQRARETARAAIASGTSFWRAAGAELHNMLEARISVHGWRRATALLLSFLALALAVWFVLRISRGITRPLEAVTRIAAHIASGDLGKAREILAAHGGARSGGPGAVAGGDEACRLFQAFHSMITGLDSLLAQAARSGAQVSAAAARIAASARELEAAVAEQAASTTEVSTTSRQISSTTQDLAGTMTEVTALSSEASRLTGSGREDLRDIDSTVQRLLAAALEISAKLDVIRRRTAGITDIVSAITLVANRTNLLSLNAAIEAEKAGESGRGFSVVAREIRRLADQTSVAAMDIEAMITEMHEAVTEGVAEVGRFTGQTTEASAKIGVIIDRLGGVIDQTGSLVPRFEVVNQGMQIQSQSAGQISQAMDRLAEGILQTRDSAAEFKNVTDQIEEAARSLQRELAAFTGSRGTVADAP